MAANMGPGQNIISSEHSRHMWALRNKACASLHLTTLKTAKQSAGNLTAKQEAWLEEQGLTIKVMPRNQESLFRAIAEKLFLTQTNHEKVKEMVVKYLSDHYALMEQRVRLAYAREMATKPCAQLERDIYELGKAFGKEPVTPVHAYMYRLANGTNVAGVIEIGAMSALFKVNILVYRAIPSSPLVFGKFEAEETGNDSTIKLLNLYGSSHYDLLLPIKSITPAAICQSIVYEMLYEKVFGLQNTLAASSAVLGKSAVTLDKAEEDEQVKTLSPSSSSSSCSSSSSSSSTRRFNRKDPDALNHIKENWLPFPLKVAKSLDPSTYRDNDLDSK